LSIAIPSQDGRSCGSKRRWIRSLPTRCRGP